MPKTLGWNTNTHHDTQCYRCVPGTCNTAKSARCCWTVLIKTAHISEHNLEILTIRVTHFAQRVSDSESSQLYLYDSRFALSDSSFKLKINTRVCNVRISGSTLVFSFSIAFVQTRNKCIGWFFVVRNSAENTTIAKYVNKTERNYNSILVRKYIITSLL